MEPDENQNKYLLDTSLSSEVSDSSSKRKSMKQKRNFKYNNEGSFRQTGAIN